jgi:hypothetical protein
MADPIRGVNFDKVIDSKSIKRFYNPGGSYGRFDGGYFRELSPSELVKLLEGETVQWVVDEVKRHEKADLMEDANWLDINALSLDSGNKRKKLLESYLEVCREIGTYVFNKKE